MSCCSIRCLQNNLPIFVTLCADRLVNFIPNSSQLRFKLCEIVFFLSLEIFYANRACVLEISNLWFKFPLVTPEVLSDVWVCKLQIPDSLLQCRLNDWDFLACFFTSRSVFSDLLHEFGSFGPKLSHLLFEGLYLVVTWSLQAVNLRFDTKACPLDLRKRCLVLFIVRG